jgi:hypothetical protein
VLSLLFNMLHALLLPHTYECSICPSHLIFNELFTTTTLINIFQYQTLIVLLYPLKCRYFNNKVEEDEMDGACNTNWGEEERVCIISGKDRGKETTRMIKT